MRRFDNLDIAGTANRVRRLDFTAGMRGAVTNSPNLDDRGRPHRERFAHVLCMAAE